MIIKHCCGDLHWTESSSQTDIVDCSNVVVGIQKCIDGMDTQASVSHAKLRRRRRRRWRQLRRWRTMFLHSHLFVWNESSTKKQRTHCDCVVVTVCSLMILSSFDLLCCAVLGHMAVATEVLSARWIPHTSNDVKHKLTPTPCHHHHHHEFGKLVWCTLLFRRKRISIFVFFFLQKSPPMRFKFEWISAQMITLSANWMNSTWWYSMTYNNRTAS